MTDYELQIAYNEGCQAFFDNVLMKDNPYDGVSESLASHWLVGWQDMSNELE